MATVQFIKTTAPFIEKREAIPLEWACISAPSALPTSCPRLLDMTLLLEGQQDLISGLEVRTGFESAFLFLKYNNKVVWWMLSSTSKPLLAHCRKRQGMAGDNFYISNSTKRISDLYFIRYTKFGGYVQQIQALN